MNKIQLDETQHDFKSGMRAVNMPPNVTEDCLLMDGDEAVGFYLADAGKHSEKLKKLMDVANAELLTDRVPKSLMERSEVMTRQKKLGITRKQAKMIGTTQYSTIIGSIPPKPHMRRPYASRSSVHSVKTAQTFIKAMLLGAQELAVLMEKYMPEGYAKFQQSMEEVPKEWRFGDLFTSSISNFNIAAPYHQDKANLKFSLNAIYTKRKNANGGNLHVPDYDAVFEQPDGSLLVYPAWRNLHGVTPIEATHEGGYRNSLVFYALEGFRGL